MSDKSRSPGRLAGRVKIQRVDYRNPVHAEALIDLLDEYARSETGGGLALAEPVRACLPHKLAEMPHALSGLAWLDNQAVGLINAFESLSTFKAMPLLNIHDVAVTSGLQGQGIGTALLQWLEQQARRRGCCKLTLEVLEGNLQAQTVYRRFGFAPYALDAAYGHSLFWEKMLSE